jgi:TonB family protein
MVDRGRITRVATLAAVVLMASHASAQDTWIEAKSPNFTVVTNAGEKKARNVAWQFEQIRSAIEKGLPGARVRSGRPIEIIAVKNEAGMKEVAPSFWEQGQIRPASVLAGAGDRVFIALRTDVDAADREGVNPHSQSYWSYSALVIDESFSRPLPLWFSRGLAAVLSNSIVRENELQFGRVIPSFLRLLQGQGRLRLDQLFAVDQRSPYYTSATTRGLFDAQCWGLMQFLLYGEAASGNWDRIATVTKLLLAGKPSLDAVREAYGTLEALETRYATYLKSGRIMYQRIKVENDVSAEKYPTRRLPAIDVEAARAGFHVASGRIADARMMLNRMKESDSKSARAYELEGLAFDRERNVSGARQAYAKAAELGSTNFYTYARLAALETPTPGTSLVTARQKLLAKAIELNDVHAPSFANLANVMLAANQPEGALGLAQRAVALEPDRFAYRLLLGRVLARLSRRADVQATAQVALALAVTDAERQEVKALVESLDRPPAGGGRGPDGVPGGAVGAIVGGLPAPPPPPPPPPPSAPVRVGGAIKQPVRLKNVPPVYPAIAQSAQVQGVVIIEAVIGVDGKVTDTRVLRSIPLLDQAALDAVRQWEFSVTTLNGVPVPVIMTVTVQFTLTSPEPPPTVQ